MQPASGAKDVIKSLTGLRGIACLFVILDHSCRRGRTQGPVSVQTAGNMSVYFFFVLSGYLLLKRALEEVQACRTDPVKRFLGWNMFYYYLRRFCRIYPPFFVAVLLYRLQTTMTAQDDPEDMFLRGGAEFDVKVWNWVTLAVVNNHLWTMRIEIIFYFVVLPAVILLLSEMMVLQHKSPQLLGGYLLVFVYLGLFAITFFLHMYNGYIFDPFLQRAEFIKHIPAFAYGCFGGAISYYMRYHEVQFPIVNRTLRNIVVELFTWSIMLRIFLGNIEIARVYLGMNNDKEWNSLTSLCPAFSLLLLVLELVNSDCSIGRFFSSPVIYTMGEISYSTYLVHFGAVFLVETYTKLNGLEGTSLQVLVAHTLGMVLYYIVENPCMLLGKYGVKWIELLRGSSDRQKVPNPLLFELDTTATTSNESS